MSTRSSKGQTLKYPHIEKIAFTLILASRKLLPYFLANPIFVIMDQTIKKLMNKPKVVGRMIWWAIELNQFDI